MKCFLVSILLLNFISELCESALIGSTIKTFYSIPDTGKQKTCKVAGKTLCHLEVRSNVTPTLSRMCVDGKVALVKIPEGYTGRTAGLPKCNYAGQTFCDGDNITPNYKGWSKRHYCVNGEPRYSVTGRRLKTNRPIIGKPASSASSSTDSKPSTSKKPSPFSPPASQPVDDSSAQVNPFDQTSNEKPAKPSFGKPTKPAIPTKKPSRPSFTRPNKPSSPSKKPFVNPWASKPSTSFNKPSTSFNKEEEAVKPQGCRK